MTVKLATRGRPKGTGVNDASQLARIRSLLSANPEMKPTTAIKAIGITDPSTIRRLRDKFKAIPATENRQSARPKAAAERPAVRTRPAPVPVSRPVPRAPRTQANGMAGSLPAPEAPDPAPVQQAEPANAEFLMSMYSAGVSMASATMQFQVDAFAFALQGSPMACFLRGQVIVSEFAAAMLADNAGHDHTRH